MFTRLLLVILVVEPAARPLAGSVSPAPEEAPGSAAVTCPPGCQCSWTNQPDEEERAVSCGELANLKDVLEYLQGGTLDRLILDNTWPKEPDDDLYLDELLISSDFNTTRLTFQPVVLQFYKSVKVEEVQLLNYESNFSSVMFNNFAQMLDLKRIVIRNCSFTGEGHDPDVFASFWISETVLESLEELTITHSDLSMLGPPGITVGPADSGTKTSYPLRRLDLSHNRLEAWRLAWLVGEAGQRQFNHLTHLNLSHNAMGGSILTPAQTSSPPVLPSLTTLDLSHNPELTSLCNCVFLSLPALQVLDLSFTDLVYMPTILSTGLPSLTEVRLTGTLPNCDCQTGLLTIQSADEDNLIRTVECRMPSGNIVNFGDDSLLEEMTCDEPTIDVISNDTDIMVGDKVVLDCLINANSQAIITWLSPRLELIQLTPDLSQDCEGVLRLMELSETVQKDYTTWDNHFTILPNGSLVIDEFGWRDRGEFRCIVNNGFGNDTASVYLGLNYHYRNRIYYVSLAYGFGVAGCFLGLTLLAKLLHHLLWNYGCCLCCACCKHQLPPKTRKLTKVVDSIETYRIQQLEKLRENYNLQSQRIRDNCSMQMERVRENYNMQVNSLKEMKNYGSAQCQSVRDQYADNITRIREYSTSQLEKCHENYIFQRQRLRKFSAQNYLKIRETKNYTQKTLNRVMDNLPALYIDLTSCRQGFPDPELTDWPHNPDVRNVDLIVGLDGEVDSDILAGAEESQSLYFTPTGTPLREIPQDFKYSPVTEMDMNGCVPSDTYGPGADQTESVVGRSSKHRSHRRMPSSLSNFLPFWWGMNQTDSNNLHCESPCKNQTVVKAIVEVDGTRNNVMTADDSVTASIEPETQTTASGISSSEADSTAVKGPNDKERTAPTVNGVASVVGEEENRANGHVDDPEAMPAALPVRDNPGLEVEHYIDANPTGEDIPN